MQKNRPGGPIYVVVLCIPLIFFTGCIATTREYVDLRDEIYQLQLKLNEVQKNQADLSSKMDTLMSGMDSLTAELEETRNSMSLFGQRLDDVETNLSKKMSKMSEKNDPLPSASAVAVAPSKIYQLAYSDFSRGKYDLALVGFKSYLDDQPAGELADQAQYYLGECYAAQNLWEKAYDEYQQVADRFPNSPLLAAATLKKALCLEKLDKIQGMKVLLNSLVNDYPDTPEAITAKEKLKSFQK